MTNAPSEIDVFSDAFICRPSLGQWIATAGWLVLLLGIIVLMVTLLRQAAMLRHTNGQRHSERLSALVITTGWFSLIVAIGMTWYGLHSTWADGAMVDTIPQGFLFVCYAQSSIPGFIGLLIWAGSYFEAALFKTLWMRKMEAQQSGPAYPPQGVGSADP